MKLAEGEEREMGGVVVGVLAAAEDLLLLGEHADDGEDVAFDLDFFAEADSWPKSSSAASWPSTTTLARRCSSSLVKKRPCSRSMS